MENLKKNPIFCSLYKGREKLALDQFQQLIDTHKDLYGSNEVSLFSVSGRTEVMGNHTDHNFGKVLAASVNLDVKAVAKKTDDNIVRVKSEGYPEIVIDYSDLGVYEEEKYTSDAIIRGVGAAFVERGRAIGGFTACITSDVPGGSGLSSSAAFENMIGTILNYLYNDAAIDYVELAQISQRAENHNFGKPCGLMDQIACAAGGFVTIDFGDPEHPITKKVDFDMEKAGYHLCIIKTGGSHADLNDDYASVPGEMKAVAKEMGQDVLRGLTTEQIIESIPTLRQKLGDRPVLRALHFLEENKRVELAVSALEKGDTSTFLSLVNASGISSAMFLQNYFTCKAPQEQGITMAVAAAKSILNGDGAARVHGGGFAGTAQAFVPVAKMESFREAMEKAFGKGSVTELSIRAESAIRIC